MGANQLFSCRSLFSVWGAVGVSSRKNGRLLLPSLLLSSLLLLVVVLLVLLSSSICFPPVPPFLVLPLPVLLRVLPLGLLSAAPSLSLLLPLLPLLLLLVLLIELLLLLLAAMSLRAMDSGGAVVAWTVSQP